MKYLVLIFFLVVSANAFDERYEKLKDRVGNESAMKIHREAKADEMRRKHQTLDRAEYEKQKNRYEREMKYDNDKKYKDRYDNDRYDNRYKKNQNSGNTIIIVK